MVENNNSVLMVERGARRVDRAELRAQPAPTPLGPRHAPQAPALVLDVLTQALAEGGFTVRREELALYRGGDVLIGVLDLDSEDSALLRPGQLPSIAIRTSTNREFATTLGVGQRILVCSNGCFHASQVVMRRRSTIKIQLRDEVMRAVDRIRERSVDLIQQMDRARSIKLSDTQAKTIIFDTFRDKVLPAAKLPKVADWFFNPPAEGATDLTDAPRSLFALQNAMTREARSLPLARRREAWTRLGRLLTAV